MPRVTRILLGLTGALTVASAVAAVHATEPAHGPRFGWLLFYLAACFGESLRVADERQDGWSFTFSVAALVATAALYGPVPAGLIAMVAMGSVDLARGEPLLRLAFNACVYGIAGVWSALAYAAAGGVVGRPGDGDAGALLALGMTHVAITATLVGAVAGTAAGKSLWRGVSSSVLRALPPQAGEVCLGAILAFLVSRAPLLAPLVVPLLVVAYRAESRLSALHRETDVALASLADLVDERDPYTAAHSERVGELVARLARALELPERRVTALARAGRLHDLGKIVVDLSVLRKPGRLDEEEFEQLKAHPAVSSRLLQPFGFAADIARVVELHHERFDGRGYYGVAADELSLEAHFLILADAWDAMTSDRPYRQALSVEAAAAELARGLGSQFHPVLGRAFVALVQDVRLDEALEPAQLRALRAALTVPRRLVAVRRVARGLTDAARVSGGRLLLVTAVACAAAAISVPSVMLPMGAFALAAGLGGLLVLRASRRSTGRLLTVLRHVRESESVDDVVAALDPEFPVLWAGRVQVNGDGVRREQEWVSAAAPASLGTRIDGALRRSLPGLRPGRPAEVSVAGHSLILMPEPESGWLGVLPVESQLPPALLEGLAEQAAAQW